MTVSVDPETPSGGSSADATGSRRGRAARLLAVREQIVAAARRVGRSPAAVTLVVVSKQFDVEAIEEVRAAGQVDFGESRAQELLAKAPALGSGLRWHFVGRLQTNKVRDVVGCASLVHSVDRERLARAIAERARAEQRIQPVLVQVNVGDDPAKAGVALPEVDGAVAMIRELEGLACQGLMTMPPLRTDPRPLFGRLREARDRLVHRFPEVQHLSMGMTSDYEVAVEEGATIVRVGEAVFGARPRAA